MTAYPFALNASQFISQLFCLLYGKKMSFFHRIVVSSAIIGAVLFAMPFVIDIGGSEAYWICFVLLLVMGWFNGLLQNTCFELAAQFPEKNMAGMVVGQGLVGILLNLYRDLTLRIWPKSESEQPSGTDDDNAFYSAIANYFAGGVIMIVAIVLFYTLKAMDRPGQLVRQAEHGHRTPPAEEPVKV